MHYTQEDLKAHQELLRQMAAGKHVDSLKVRELHIKLTKQTLDTILQPREGEDVYSFLQALLETIIPLFLKDEKHIGLNRALTQIDTLGGMISVDPLRYVNWATRKLLVTNAMIPVALRYLSTNGTVSGGELAKEILPKSDYNERHACLLAGTTLRQLIKHGLAMRIPRGRFKCYGLTDTGQRVLDLMRNGRL